VTTNTETLIRAINCQTAQRQVLDVISVNTDAGRRAVGAGHSRDRTAGGVATHGSVGAIAVDGEAAGSVLQENSVWSTSGGNLGQRYYQWSGAAGSTCFHTL